MNETKSFRAKSLAKKVINDELTSLEEMDTTDVLEGLSDDKRTLLKYFLLNSVT